MCACAAGKELIAAYHDTIYNNEHLQLHIQYACCFADEGLVTGLKPNILTPAPTAGEHHHAAGACRCPHHHAGAAVQPHK